MSSLYFINSVIVYDIVTRQCIEEWNSAADSSEVNGILYVNFNFGCVQLELYIFMMLEFIVLNHEV